MNKLYVYAFFVTMPLIGMNTTIKRKRDSAICINTKRTKIDNAFNAFKNDTMSLLDILSDKENITTGTIASDGTIYYGTNRGNVYATKNSHIIKFPICVKGCPITKKCEQCKNIQQPITLLILSYDEKQLYSITSYGYAFNKYVWNIETQQLTEFYGLNLWRQLYAKAQRDKINQKLFVRNMDL